MPDEKPNEGQSKEPAANPQDPNKQMGRASNEEEIKEKAEKNTGQSTSAEENASKNTEKKPKRKKADAIEKLKSKPPEKVKEEIKKNYKSQFIKYKTLSIIVSIILFLTLFVLALVISYYKNQTPPPDVNYVPEAEIELPTDTQKGRDETSSWEKYQNKELGINIKLPTYIKIEEEEKKLTLVSESINCTTNATTDGKADTIPVSNYLIEIIKHNLIETAEYEDAWKEIFNFELSGNNDGEMSIGGTTGNYFFQGAESLYGRKAILIETSENTFFEINVYTPTLAYNCEKELIDSTEQTKINEKILSTIEFTESDVRGISTSSTPCINENQDILSEILQCEEINEKTCLEYIDQFEYCMESCLNVVSEEQCINICRPVCEAEVLKES
jgi:hypothetical protein